MQVQSIRLLDFRNYEKQVIDVHSGINVFFGDNAQGKTNILEAVYLCACARSHRTAKDKEIIRQGKDAYAVQIEYMDPQGIKEKIEIQYFDVVSGDSRRNRARRIVKHNGLALPRVGDLMGLFHAVIFAPEDLMLVKEGPSARRRYLDLLISQVRPSYFLHLQQYGKLLSQRNSLLKKLRGQGPCKDEEERMQRYLQMEVWDQALASQAAALIVQRKIYADRIATIAKKAQKEISSGKEKLNVKYKTISGIDPISNEKDIEDSYLVKLKTMVDEDIERGITLHGPHRDDLDLRLDGESLKPYASQGQQRSTVLALKLAELQILQEEVGEAPVLLLDDVMSELDVMRRDSLLSHIKEAQVFVTCTDKDQVARVLDSQREKQKEAWETHFFKVSEGQVKPCDTALYDSK